MPEPIQVYRCKLFTYKCEKYLVCVPWRNRGCAQLSAHLSVRCWHAIVGSHVNSKLSAFRRVAGVYISVYY